MKETTTPSPEVKKDLPSSTPRSPKKNKEWGAFAALWVGLLAFLLPQFILGFILATYVELTNGDFDSFFEDDNIAIGFILSLAVSIGSVLVIYFFLRNRGFNFRAIGLKRPEWRSFGYVLPAYGVYLVAAIAAFALLAQFVPSIDLDQDQVTGFEEAAGTLELALTFILLAVIVPISEEILFRGFILRGIARDFGPYVAAILTSLLFGIAHWQLNVGIDTFLMGLAASWLVFKTNNLWPAITLHSLKNALAFVLVFVVT